MRFSKIVNKLLILVTLIGTTGCIFGDKGGEVTATGALGANGRQDGVANNTGGSAPVDVLPPVTPPPAVELTPLSQSGNGTVGVADFYEYPRRLASALGVSLSAGRIGEVLGELTINMPAKAATENFGTPEVFASEKLAVAACSDAQNTGRPYRNALPAGNVLVSNPANWAPAKNFLASRLWGRTTPTAEENAVLDALIRDLATNEAGITNGMIATAICVAAAMSFDALVQ
ncbi:MAG: hypothetical protein AB1540_05250 [Bdellovibrionota bacterium]